MFRESSAPIFRGGSGTQCCEVLSVTAVTIAVARNTEVCVVELTRRNLERCLKVSAQLLGHFLDGVTVAPEEALV